MPLSSDLSTLEALYNTLKNDVDYAHSIVSETGTSLDAAVWESPNADAFRAAWDEFRPKLVQFEVALAAAATDVANNHNNNALGNGVTDAPELSSVEPYEAA